jgi:hypothetical protein
MVTQYTDMKLTDLIKNREEMDTGLDELDEYYSHLFHNTLQSQLEKSTSQK